MSILLPLLLGVIAGKLFIGNRFQKGSLHAQMVCTVLLITCMGIKLGQDETVMNELLSMGLKSLLFAVFSILGSVVCVYFFTKKWGKKTC